MRNLREQLYEPSFKLKCFGAWEFDPSEFHFNPKQVFVQLTMTIFENAGLLIDISMDRMRTFSGRVADVYLVRPNSYHNIRHAMHVLHSVYILTRRGGISFDDPTLALALYIAALCHDLDHPGLTNRFLALSSDKLCERYSGKSPLEIHHATTAIELIEECDLFEGPVSLSFKRMLFRLIMATNIASHDVTS